MKILSLIGRDCLYFREKKMILNLTQHEATPDQLQAGVVDLPEADCSSLKRLLNFGTLPSASEIGDRAASIAAMARRFVGEEEAIPQAMIGGALFFMAPLERALRSVGIEPVYAFSVRESVESKAPDGSVLKTNKFRHVGFVPAV
jgi:hypothetical protein